METGYIIDEKILKEATDLLSLYVPKTCPHDFPLHTLSCHLLETHNLHDKIVSVATRRDDKSNEHIHNLQKFIIARPADSIINRALSAIEKGKSEKVPYDFEIKDEESLDIHGRKKAISRYLWEGCMKTIIKYGYHTTSGLIYQTEHEFSLRGLPVNENNILSLFKSAFVENQSNKKALFAGSDFFEKIDNMEFNRLKIERHKRAFGVPFNTITSMYGELSICFEKVFDDIDKSDFGFIIDMDDVVKYTTGYKLEPIDGELALTETFALVLKNPDSHIKVYLH